MDKGARFHRCDFQVHSPRDPKWKGRRPADESGRAAWADALVAACRTKGLNAIAITDHHDVTMVKYAQEAAKREKGKDGEVLTPDRQLVVFPGMEVTLSGVPCQCLVLFDADLPLQLLGQLPGILGYDPAPDDEPKSRDTVALTRAKSPNDVVDALGSQSYLKGRFIVLPHVQDGGHKSLIRSGFAEHYRGFNGVGGYVDGEISPDDTKSRGMKAILDGRDAAYGNKALAVFQTSDSRSEDFASLGTASTWVKWSSPTAEALRQSCLARGSRLSQTQPRLPDICIRRLEVSASVFLGGVNLFLNPQYNALIGGRGTGKSTTLEYLRWAVCAPSAVDSGEDLPEFERRTQALLEATLQRVEGQVRVWASVNGVEHVVERRTTPPGIFVKVADGEFEACSEEQVQRLLPVEAYRQKQLSSVGATKGDILKFLLAPVSREVKLVEDEIRSAEDGIRAAFGGLQSAASRRRERGIVAAERESLVKQRESRRNEIQGLSSDDQKLLRDGERFAEESRTVEEWRARLSSITAKVESLAADLRDLPRPAPDLPNAALLAAAHLDLQQRLNAARDSLTAVRQETAGAADRLRSAADQHRTLLDAARVRYAEALARSKGHAAAIQEIERLNMTIAQRESRLTALDAELVLLEGAEKTFEAAQLRWKQTLDRRGFLTRKRCEQVAADSGGDVRGVFRACAEPRTSIHMMGEFARGSRIRAERFETLGKNIASANSLDEWLRVLEELRSLIGVKADEAELPHCPSLRAADFGDKELRALAQKLDDETWLRLRLAAPDDVVEFEYKTRENSYIPFHVASAGQRATSLMKLLLAQGGGPLVIDQPEDDLDNRVIHQIAESLGRAKQSRQLIFASHNANLVVNGDADLIAVFDYRVAGEQTSGTIACEGAIDDPAVRDGVTSVMEGGKNAFVLRRAKYGF